MLVLQKINKFTAAKAGILRVQRVNMLHELALTTDREFILRIYHIPGRAGRMPESNPGGSHVQA